MDAPSRYGEITWYGTTAEKLLHAGDNILSSHQGGEGFGWYRLGIRHVYLCAVPEACNVVIVL
jgi:hypothetical protein